MSRSPPKRLLWRSTRVNSMSTNFQVRCSRSLSACGRAGMPREGGTIPSRMRRSFSRLVRSHRGGRVRRLGSELAELSSRMMASHAPSSFVQCTRCWIVSVCRPQSRQREEVLSRRICRVNSPRCSISLKWVMKSRGVSMRCL